MALRGTVFPGTVTPGLTAGRPLLALCQPHRPPSHCSSNPTGLSVSQLVLFPLPRTPVSQTSLSLHLLQASACVPLFRETVSALPLQNAPLHTPVLALHCALARSEGLARNKCVHVLAVSRLECVVWALAGFLQVSSRKC